MKQPLVKLVAVRAHLFFWHVLALSRIETVLGVCRMHYQQQEF